MKSCCLAFFIHTKSSILDTKLGTLGSCIILKHRKRTFLLQIKNACLTLCQFQNFHNHFSVSSEIMLVLSETKAARFYTCRSYAYFDNNKFRLTSNNVTPSHTNFFFPDYLVQKYYLIISFLSLHLLFCFQSKIIPSNFSLLTREAQN